MADSERGEGDDQMGRQTGQDCIVGGEVRVSKRELELETETDGRRNNARFGRVKG